MTTGDFDLPEIDVVRCDQCGDTFEKIGQHWSHKPDHRPELTDEQRRLVDAEVRHGEVQIESDRVNSYIEFYSTHRPDLRDLDETLGVLSLGIEESIPIVARRLGITVAEGESVYRLRTRSHPAFDQWADQGDDQQSHLGEWVESEPTEGDVFDIPSPDTPIVSIRERLREWAEEREQFTSVTVSMTADEADARSLFEGTPVSPISYADHGDAVDVSLDGNEVAAWV